MYFIDTYQIPADWHKHTVYVFKWMQRNFTKNKKMIVNSEEALHAQIAVFLADTTRSKNVIKKSDIPLFCVPTQREMKEMILNSFTLERNECSSAINAILIANKITVEQIFGVRL